MGDHWPWELPMGRSRLEADPSSVMKHTWKDAAATAIVAIVVVVYLVFDGVPLVRDASRMAAVGLILGFASRRVGGRSGIEHEGVAFAAALPRSHSASSRWRPRASSSWLCSAPRSSPCGPPPPTYAPDTASAGSASRTEDGRADRPGAPLMTTDGAAASPPRGDPQPRSLSPRAREVLRVLASRARRAPPAPRTDPVRLG